MYLDGYYSRAQVVWLNSAAHGFSLAFHAQYLFIIKEFLSHAAVYKQSHNTDSGTKLQQNRAVYRNRDTFHCPGIRALQLCMGVQQHLESKFK